MLESFERHCVAEMLRQFQMESKSDDIIQRLTVNVASRIGQIDDSILNVLRLTEEAALRKAKRKEIHRLNYLSSLKYPISSKP